MNNNYSLQPRQHGMTITKKELTTELRRLGLREGDHLMVHSSYTAIGEVEGGPASVAQVLMDVVGSKGTLVMPAFNWDYFRESEKILDLVHTPSRMGIISETFRTLPEVRGSRNLFHPLRVWGRFQKKILDCDSFDTWGEESPYAFMYHQHFKILLIGVDLNRCVIMHYCEQKAKAWYRKPIIYSGYRDGRWCKNSLPVQKTRNSEQTCFRFK